MEDLQAVAPNRQYYRLFFLYLFLLRLLTVFVCIYRQATDLVSLRCQRMVSPEQETSRPTKRPRVTHEGQETFNALQDCPYMDTINRSSLDFDLPPICSVSLVSHNVYACLVCGRNFHGRSPSSPAYMHALHDTHHLFLNLTTEQIYCLPDDYQVSSPTLTDIISALRPHFKSSDLTALDTQVVKVRLNENVLRIRGAVAFDELHASNSANVILHLFLRPRRIRNELLLHDPFADPSHSVPAVAVRNALSHICRKLWATHAFRSHVAPHIFMQVFTRETARHSSLTSSKLDPVDFLAWLINTITAKTRHRKPNRENTVQDNQDSVFKKLTKGVFSGTMQITTKSPDKKSVKVNESPFWYLSLDLPPKPLFKHENEREIVEQVALGTLLKKYNGETHTHVVETGASRSFEILHAPDCLFLVLRRFARSKFATEKNPCVVHLPTDVLPLGQVLRREEFGDYRLVGAVSHSGSLEKGQFRVAIFHDASNAWFDVTDVSVEQTLFQLVSLTDTYVLLYERCFGV